MTTMTRRGGIEIGRGAEMAHLLEEIERESGSVEAEECWTTASFLVPSVRIRLPRRKGTR
jgi:hypothetical protein